MGRHYQLAYILELIADYLKNSEDINLTASPCFIVILCGKRYPGLSEDKRRLLAARRLAVKLIAIKASVSLIFSAYKEIKDEAIPLMNQLFDKDIKWEVVVDKSFKIEDSRTQVESLIERFKHETNVIIVTDKWHRPRVVRYLKYFNKPNWQVYSDNSSFSVRKSIIEFIKIVKYHQAGDLEI
ncbi:hypothetical protein A3A66_00885 [Microgenomates group bacterium RIFCSPLOWO2_01_FULL_46_13]|nr:MAG: hypothetical protein A2783_02970 [Microgenomates group bacterium RIFCSPHIGHO2_01_FULL_45_11]OGV94562.1 MAG: hypothetical protein A3A66_00885 [Microgenomates group bacterium RIFCSPLOWO2_01_FULL_46_13]